MNTYGWSRTAGCVLAAASMLIAAGCQDPVRESGPIELGQLVRIFMVDTDGRLSWFMGTDDSSLIAWKTDGIDEVQSKHAFSVRPRGSSMSTGVQH